MKQVQLPAHLPRLLTPAEAMAALGKDRKTIAKWASKGKIRVAWTPGHTRRYYAEDVEALKAEAGR